jgi:hypothetical protein
MAVKAARQGASGPNIKGYTHEASTQKESWITALGLSKYRATDSLPEKKHHG